MAQQCEIIVTVGFALADATKAAAEANTGTNFAIIDDNSIELPNVKPLMFDTAQAAYLAGYAAAGYSKTGTVATFGGRPFPSVTIFMDGFVDGVAKYNEDKGANVEVLGWDKASADRLLHRRLREPVERPEPGPGLHRPRRGRDHARGRSGGAWRRDRGQGGRRRRDHRRGRGLVRDSAGLPGHRPDVGVQEHGPCGLRRRRQRPPPATSATSRTSERSRTAASPSRRSTTSTREVPAELKSELEALQEQIIVGRADRGVAELAVTALTAPRWRVGRSSRSTRRSAFPAAAKPGAALGSRHTDTRRR